MARTRVYPHVDQVHDPQIRQALRILFDRTFDLGDTVDGVTTRVADHATQLSTITTDLRHTRDLANAAIEVAGKFTTTAAGDIVPTPPVPPGIDDGSGAQGCAAARGNGHPTLTDAEKRTAPEGYRIGLVVCGTAQEFPALLAPAASAVDRDNNLEELLGRIVWHLQQFGYTAGRNRNPSGAIGIDNVVVITNRGPVGYDVYPASNFSAYGDYTQQATMQMIQLLPNETEYVPDGGIPD